MLWRWHCAAVSEPVHVGKAGQYVGSFAKVTILLVVAPQEVHIVNFTLVLLDHMHQMFFQVWRIHLDPRAQGQTQVSYTGVQSP